MQRLAILISGRGSNMEAIVRHVQAGCLQGTAEIACIISNKPDAQGIERAQNLGVEALYAPPPCEPYLLELLKEREVTWVILAGFMEILSSAVIGPYRDHILNIHPADPALYKGPKAYAWAFEQGLQETTVTIQYVDEGVDTGAIIAQRPVDLRGAQTLEEVRQKGLAIEHALYAPTIKEVLTSCVAS